MQSRQAIYRSPANVYQATIKPEKKGFISSIIPTAFPYNIHSTRSKHLSLNNDIIDPSRFINDFDILNKNYTHFAASRYAELPSRV